ncbi:hypothetical protein AGMMS49938_08680 [Fibrobacterales bacterium]|nr:hypothetical protein AGMMS49938_08680 [Fibrobacterales bacterium]
MVVSIIFAVLLALILFVLAAILSSLKALGDVVKNIKLEVPKIEIPAPKVEVSVPPIELPKIEVPKIEIPKIEIPKIEMPNIEFPKFEIPKIELPKIEIPHFEIPKLDTSEIVEAIKNIKIEVAVPHFEIPAQSAVQAVQSDPVNAEALQELATLIRVNQAEFGSGLEAFHKAIDKLISKIPNGEKEEENKKELLEKFEDTIVAIQEKANETMNENALRLQELLTEALKSGAS